MPPGRSRQTSTAPGAVPLRPAIGNWRAVALFLVAAALGASADLLSKHYVFTSMLANPQLADEISTIQGRLVELRDEQPMTAEEALRERSLQPLLTRQALGPLYFTISTNPGVVFGIRLPRAVIIGVSALAFALVVTLFATSDRRDWPIHLALAWILAGAIGNFYDRLIARVEVPNAGVITGQVRDFIDCTRLHYKWIFNVADVLLVVGVAVLMVHWWLARPPAKQTTPSADTPATTTRRGRRRR